MSELKAKIVSEFDAGPVESGVAKVKRSMWDLTQATEEAGKKGEEGFKKIGNGADEAAKKNKRSTASIERELQRVIAQMESAGDKAKELELRMQMRGIDTSTFSGYLSKIRELQKAQQDMAASGEMSGKAMSAALRNVPAQMTDIIVSLQGGQKPMTVLLQQGGQLKDMFGGVGAALKAVGGYALGMVNPLTVSAAAVAALAMAYNSGANEAHAFGKSLALNNDQIGLSRDQLVNLSAAVASLSSSGNLGKAAEVMNAIAANGKTGTGAIHEMGLAITELSAITSKSVDDLVGEYEQLAKSPYEASLKLQESYNHLNAATLEHIKSLEDQGKKADAAAVAQKALANAQLEAAERVKANLGALERAWAATGSAAKSAWDWMLGLGRADTAVQKLQKQTEIVTTLRDKLQSRMDRGIATSGLEQQLTASTKYLQQLTQEVKAETAANRERSTRNKLQSDGVAALAAVSAVNEKGLSKTQQMNKALENYRANIETLRKANPNSALLDPKQIAAGEAAIRSQYKEAAKASAAGGKAAETQAQNIAGLIAQEKVLIARIRERGTQADKLTEGEKLAIKIQQELTGKLSGKARAQKEASLAAAQELAGLQKTRVAEEERAKAIDASEKAMLKAIDAQLKGAEANRTQTQSIRDQIDAIGKSRTEIAAAALAREQAEFERAADSGSWDPTFLDAWLAKLKEGAAVVAGMRELDFRQASYNADEMQRSLELGVQYAKQDLDLVFLSGDQRERVVAMREIERDLAEQIYKIDKMSISEAEKQTLKDKAAINARLRLEQTAAKQVSDSWQKTADTINESLTDALLRGFEDGKGFAENFRDTLKNMINTLVLKPVISFVVNPIGNVISTLINGALGSLTNGVLGGGNTLGSLINNASSAYSALTGNNPVLNAAANWLGFGNTLGAGQGVLAAGSPGAAGAWTGLGAGQGVLAPGAPGAAGAYTGGTTGMLGSLGTAAWIAAPLAIGMWGMSSMPSRPDYSGYASASSDPTRDAAAPTASGLTVDIANGIIPSLEALQAALADSTNGLSINEQYSLAVGPEDRLTWAGAPDLIGSLERAGVTFADDLSREYLQRMSRGDQVFYTGEGYVDPSTMWIDGQSSGMRDFTYSAEMTQWGRQVAQSILGQLESVADVFDLDSDFRVIAGLRDEAKRDLLYAGLRIQQGDETLVDFEGKVGEGGTQEALRQFAAQTLEAFKGLDLPDWATSLVTETQTAINELDAEELGDKLGQTAIDSLNAVQAALVQTARVLDQLGKSVLEFGGYSQDVIYQITSLMGGVDSFNSVYSAYVQAFYTEQEQLDLLQRQLQEQFGALNVTMPSTIEGFRSLVESLDLNDEASRSLFASLLSISPQFAQFVTAMGTVEEVVEEVTKTVADLYAEAKSRTDGSFAAYQKNQQKVIDQWSDVQTAAEEAAEEARSLFDLLHDSVRELYGNVDSTRAMQADQGNAYISAALAAARATGILPDYEALSDAISGARGGLVSSGFDSKAEYEAAQLILAGRLSELEGYADSQLTEAERQAAYAQEQIDLINKEIALQQEMIAAIREGNEFQGTIAELAQAILDERAAKEALEAERAAAAGKKGAGSGGLSFGVDGKFVGSGDQGKWFATRQDAEDELRRINAAGGYGYVRISGSGWEAFEMGSGFSEYGAIKSLADLIRSGASGDAVLEAAVGKQVSQLTRAMGFADDKAMADWLREQGYTVGSGGLIGPRNSFAVGTNFVPYDMVAQIHRGERIIPAADNSALIAAVNGRDGGMQAQRTEQQIATLQKGFSATVRELSDVKNLLKRLATVSEATYQKA
ncbi:phage tail length tape measure family protein [Comamonas serinivorans]|nr:phage tail length tape measure family protein [Comamonas serinivorans]